MVVTNRYELNIARKGIHYGRVIFPGNIDEQEASARANFIKQLMTSTEIGLQIFTFRLTVWSAERGTTIWDDDR